MRLLFTLFCILFHSSLSFSQGFPHGTWRIEAEMTQAKIPFLLDLDLRGPSKAILINGKEKIRLTPLPKDQDFFRFEWPHHALSIEFKLMDKKLDGYFIKHHKQPIEKIKIQGIWGEFNRFDKPIKKTTLKSKNYSIELGEEKTKSLLQIKIKEGRFSANIQTPSGDYRYIEGIVEGNHLKGASFDGVYNYLFSANVVEKKIAGSLSSSQSTLFQGEESNNHSFINHEKTEIEKIDFSFPDLSGKKISLKDKKFKDKPVIIQFFGSWCPNCIDETQFLIPWFNQNKHRGINIIALAYERAPGQKEAHILLKKFIHRYKPGYPFLLASGTAQEKPTQHFKELKNFYAFPTTLYLNKKHEIVHIHAGFNGPASGSAFETWKKDFKKLTDELISEKK